MPLSRISSIFAKRTPTVEETADEPAEVEQPKNTVADDLSVLTERSQNTSSGPEGPQAGDELAKTAHEARDTGVSAIDEADFELETETESELESEEEPMSTDPNESQENSPAEPIKDEQTPSTKPIDVPGSLSETLSEVFQKRITRDPLVQALLDEHGQVDIQDLASDLRKLADELGARSD